MYLSCHHPAAQHHRAHRETIRKNIEVAPGSSFAGEEPGAVDGVENNDYQLEEEPPPENPEEEYPEVKPEEELELVDRWLAS
ncbi:hypothetical protein CCHOA_00575 [Corynebacterium choanae]|uniref:Uncharacterized protein n=1 Tax=Corynebacterium choanae TaxID=1862358 RepID=A0A3G6J946_9CORY|nr:hypothetical protein CCHOA_00575 [Corynebacterium choanae]